MNDAVDRFRGCVLGLALGDALGAPLEGGLAERFLWRLIGRTSSGAMRWTDDTQMTVDVMESLLARGGVDQDDLARRFAASYCWSRGYGPATARVLKRIARGEDWRNATRSVHRDGSFGNGAAMRAPVVGLFYADRGSEIDAAIRASAEVTHAHELGIAGARLVGQATAAALHGGTHLAGLMGDVLGDFPARFAARLGLADAWLTAEREVPAVDIRRGLGNGVAAVDSCVTAVYLAVRFRHGDFLQMLRMAADIGGDTDTIGAMAGAVWGAANGVSRLPDADLARLERRDGLAEMATRLHACSRFHRA